MKLRPQFCTRPGDVPGEYAFFAESPGPEWEEIRDPVQVNEWRRDFPLWILETRAHIQRAEKGAPRLIDWRATPAEMRAHVEKLQREMRTDERPRLFRRPLTAVEQGFEATP
jgi:hypothetical protein